MNTAYLHDLDPYIIQLNFAPFSSWFGEDFGLRWYGMAYLVGFILAYLMWSYMSKKNLIPLTKQQLGDYLTYAAFGTMIGGRLGYCFFYAPETLTDFHGNFPFWGVLEVHKGGMASHGGIAGIMVASYLYARKVNVPTLLLIDLSSLAGGVGIFFGRIANFINGELFGRECAEKFWLAVKFPQELTYWAGYKLQNLNKLFPVVEKMGEQKLIDKQVYSEQWTAWLEGFNYNSLARSQIYDIIDKIILAVQNGNQIIQAELAPILTPRYPSQLFQAGMEGFLVFVACFVFWLKPQKPGVITGVFGLLYALMRILGEQFRMPDAHIGYQALGMTRGQWLSVGMIFVALAVIYVCSKSKNKKYGGWALKK